MTPSRLWLSGFLLLGLLFGLLGSLVVVWQYHIDADPQLIGLHFLFLNAGYVTAAMVCQSLTAVIAPRGLVRIACIASCVSLASLSLVAPPAPAPWRLAALAAIGLSAGTLGTALLYGAEGAFAIEPVRTTNRAGILFGCGCLLANSILASSYFSGSPLLAISLLCAVPIIVLAAFTRSKQSGSLSAPNPEQENVREMLRDLRSIATLLLSLLLFFQFGNEWAIAGWLPLFLIHRLGSNPALAIATLGAYFLALMLGRLLAQRLLNRIPHRRLLIASISWAVCGFVLLTFADSLTLAAVAVMIVGTGFAPIYPLLAERLDDRFSFHPGFYNGTISIAVTGAMSIPWLLGFVAASFGISYVMIPPALGSIIVLLLSLLLMFEAHLMKESAKGDDSARAAGAP